MDLNESEEKEIVLGSEEEVEVALLFATLTAFFVPEKRTNQRKKSS